jgi:hypothetical protein|uniref:Uncharacterized protein n=1 Tax=viral metagenome TaxID=1070528 RepID=A0A6C0IUP3_9ZZZZ
MEGIRPATLCFHVRFSDGTEQHIVMNTEKPILELCSVYHVPFCEGYQITSRSIHSYKPQVCMIPRVPSDPQLKDDTIQPGQTIGYVRFLPFYYVGKCNPLTSEIHEIHLYRYNQNYYVTVNSAIRILFDCDLISISEDYARKQMSSDESSFLVTHCNTTNMDVLSNMKKLNDIPEKTRSITAIRTDTIDRIIALHGVNIHLQWEARV